MIFRKLQKWFPRCRAGALILIFIVLPRVAFSTLGQPEPHLPTDLYEQPQVDEAKFQMLPVQEQDQILKDHFIAQKRSYFDKKIRYLLLNSVASTLTIIGIHSMISTYLEPASFFPPSDNSPHRAGDHSYGASAAPQLNGASPSQGWFNRWAKQSLRSTNQIVGGVSIGYCLYNEFYTETFRAISERLWDRRPDPLEPFEIKYVMKKRFLPQAFQEKIEDQFKIARRDDTQLGVTIELVESALRLPFKNSPATYDSERMERLLAGYPELIRRKIENFSIRQVMTQALQSSSTNKGRRVAAYFYGSSGTGKTRMAELLSEGIEVPLARISLAGVTVSDLVGRSTHSDNPTPGILALAMGQARFREQANQSMVLFVDEADRAWGDSEILSFLLSFLDPEVKTIYNPYYNAEIDISHLTIVLAGKKKTADEALAKRLLRIHFSGFSLDYKKQAVWGVILPDLFCAYSQSGRAVSFNDITESERSLINQALAADKDPGFRSIQSVLMTFMDYKSRQLFFDSDASLPELVPLIEQLNEELSVELPELPKV